jgi:prepilin-type N-terminal cleavage/methylation domain-containing protein
MHTSHIYKKGFTLIELLIVIAIIALLTGIVVTSLAPSKGKARDAKRISDLGNIQLAISLYYDRCKQYPSAITGTLSSINAGCPSGISLASYISTMPVSPTPGSYTYATAGSPPNDYVLAVALESYSEVLKDDIDGTVLGLQCGTANDTTERFYCLGPK